ncbi:hypothetical protein ACLI1A_10385 [Flavobacterium sp. RHBU_3]|uniref:hypothetical protein n=1 Tax=Flavobacterium sp. RHBU_3 TaxID=3391184 RepID=UPI00398481F0
MTEAHERLRYYIDSQGFELKDFCTKFGFVYNSFTQILTGTRPLGRKIIDQVAGALPNLSIDWLLYGRGEMELSNKSVTNKNVSYQPSGKIGQVMETPAEYLYSDPVKEMFIRYLGDPDVQKVILNFVK